MTEASATIAIVDDDDAVRRALIRLVRALGFRAAPYASAEAFLAQASCDRPGCVLLDLHMPGMRGVDALVAIRQRPDPPEVVVMTGLDQPGLRDRCLEAGAAAYLTKPVDPAEVSALLLGPSSPGPG
jgi:FixJ family two-component response regulator